MELLSPSPPPRPAADRFAPPPSPASFDVGIPRARRSRPPDHPEAAADIVHVAVGRSVEKGAGLVEWAIRQFGCREMGLVHVQQPSITIPTLLGRIPARQANEGVVSAYRREELKETKKILLNYLSICNKAQVHAHIITIVSENVQKGITDLVNQHDIRKLVMGAPSENFVKVKRSSSKVAYTVKNAALSCEIWFIHNGKHVWTREPSGEPNSLLPVLTATDIESTKRFRSCSSQNLNEEPVLNQEYPGYGSYTTVKLSGDGNDAVTGLEQREYAISSSCAFCSLDRMNQLTSPSLATSTTAAFSAASPAESELSLEIGSKEEQIPKILHNQLVEAQKEAERAKKQAYAEIMKRKKLESQFAVAINRVKMFETACTHETKLREEVEDAIRTMKREQELLSDQRDKAMKELHNALSAISVIENHVQEVEHHQEKVAGELKLAQASIVSLKLERHKIRREREKSACLQELWKHYSLTIPSNCDGFVGYVPWDLKEFSLSELQSATCDFSESFKIGQGGFACAYKGEISGKTVVIKQLHPHDVQGQMEFPKEVHVLSKIKHPHLVTLIGTCSEAWYLVYEYLPNGSLQDHLIRKTNAPSLLTWKARTRIAAEMCSALLFLHSSKPEKIIHGDLKPEKVYLGSELSCKIGDIGICRHVLEEAMHCPSFHWNTEPKGAFPYKDLEYLRTGEPTPKSDIYSFGIIVLQLLTGRPPFGLAGEVRRAIVGGKLSSILDPTAGEWPQSLATRLAEFGLRCSEMNARDRPELTPEMARELEQLLVPERPVPPFFLCPIRQEIMHDPVVAADGFTYEGEALRGWLQNGRETSPMTNLKLDHLNLIPNHALRFAIQDWLCRSR
uniref:RING-type E3 ubiquitin transferase n=1 Tax=Anthurium amnicola TaxID=1678845 RepID=A0A1D1Y0E0_9ARAE